MLVTENQGIVMEKLEVQKMTERKRGKGRKQKAKLNRTIREQGWYTLKNMIQQKSSAQGKAVIEVDPAFTSQKCSACGHTDAKNRTTQAIFICQKCGHTENADVNAAKNILAAGHAATARGGDVRPQEPIPSGVAMVAASVKREPIWSQLNLFGN